MDHLLGKKNVCFYRLYGYRLFVSSFFTIVQFTLPSVVVFPQGFGGECVDVVSAQDAVDGIKVCDSVALFLLGHGVVDFGEEHIFDFPFDDSLGSLTEVVVGIGRFTFGAFGQDNFEIAVVNLAVGWTSFGEVPDGVVDVQSVGETDRDVLTSAEFTDQVFAKVGFDLNFRCYHGVGVLSKKIISYRYVPFLRPTVQLSNRPIFGKYIPC